MQVGCLKNTVADELQALKFSGLQALCLVPVVAPEFSVEKASEFEAPPSGLCGSVAQWIARRTSSWDYEGIRRLWVRVPPESRRILQVYSSWKKCQSRLLCQAKPTLRGVLSTARYRGTRLVLAMQRTFQGCRFLECLFNFRRKPLRRGWDSNPRVQSTMD